MGVCQNFLDSWSAKNRAAAAAQLTQQQFEAAYGRWAFLIFEALNDSRLNGIVCPPLDISDVLCLESSNFANFSFRVNFVKDCDEGMRRYVKGAIMPVLIRGLGISAVQIKQYFHIRIIQDKILISRR